MDRIWQQRPATKDITGIVHFVHADHELRQLLCVQWPPSVSRRNDSQCAFLKDCTNDAACAAMAGQLSDATKGFSMHSGYSSHSHDEPQAAPCSISCEGYIAVEFGVSRGVYERQRILNGFFL